MKDLHEPDDKPMNLKDISSVLNTLCTDACALTGVSIDSRRVQQGQLFVALRGAHFDGHAFIPEAVARGASAIVCSDAASDISVPQLVVPDTLEALTMIAADYRNQLTCRVIALTGSNGKTSVKEMIAAILPTPSFATPGNLNNHIGVPLSVLQLKPEHTHAVFELGANHPGEIAHTVAVVKPEVTLVNNIAPAHIEGFGSIEGVAQAKGEIYEGLPDNGTAVVNEDDDYAHYWDAVLAGKRVLRFSTQHQTADIHAREVQYDAHGRAKFSLVLPEGEASVQLAVPGAHNLSNALAAAACTYALNIKPEAIVSGLQTFSGVSGRMTYRVGKHHSVVIDDTYNANLRSVLAALEVLAGCAGRRMVVLGDMGELGEWAREHHEAVGHAARRLGIERLLTVGRYSRYASDVFGEQGHHYETQTLLVDALLPDLKADTTVLVKGSRSAGMEQVVHQLIADID